LRASPDLRDLLLQGTGAVTEQGSKRIERKLAAIFAADVAGYSRLMEADEVRTLRSRVAHRDVMDRLIAAHGESIGPTRPIHSVAQSLVID